jgi:hypothetical protein
VAGGFPAVISGTKALRLYLLTARARDVKPAARSLATTQANVSRHGATNATSEFKSGRIQMKSALSLKNRGYLAICVVKIRCVRCAVARDICPASWREIKVAGAPWRDFSVWVRPILV